MVANRPGVDTPETPAARCARLEAENRALRAMAGRLFATQEAERRAVARSLHDQAGQSLTAIRMAATLAMQEADPARVREDLADIIVQADAALAEARRLCSLLRPPQLDALGLEAALRGHVEGLARDGGPSFGLRIAALPSRPDAAVEQAGFRIAEEALDNALRHAGAARIELALDVEGRVLRLEVRDDGRGFDPATGGAGLATMAARALDLGGRVRVTTAPGQGTQVLAHLPFAPAIGGGDA